MAENYFKLLEKFEKKNLNIEKDVQSIKLALKGEIDKLKKENRESIKNFQKIKNNYFELLESKSKHCYFNNFNKIDSIEMKFQRNSLEIISDRLEEKVKIIQF